MQSQPQQPLNTSGLDLDAIGPPPHAPIDKASVQLAQKEEDFLLDGKARDHQRTQDIKDALNKVMIAGVIIAAILALILIIVRVIHLVGAKEILWLTDAQTALIDTALKFVFSSAFGGLVFKRIGQALK